jgi:hypothetical protein
MDFRPTTAPVPSGGWPDPSMSRFTRKIMNLRTPDWAGHVDEYDLRQRMRQDAAEGEPWRVVPWMVHRIDAPNRSYRLLGPEGCIYAIILRKRENYAPAPATTAATCPA